MKLVRLGDGKVISKSVVLADSWFKKTFGLLVGPALVDDQCLMIAGCRSIHTLGMSYGIDVVFIDTRGRIVKIYRGLKPYRVTGFVSGAEAVIEFKGGVAGSKQLASKQVLNLQ
ncbi:MAG: DUF192 domain-containing protein [Actinomycetota bacterium]|nr:DUF192 domain-containing protein [Actinomycetota bacterium]